MVNINIEIPEELHKKLKMAAITEDTTLKDLVVKVLNEEARKNKR